MIIVDDFIEDPALLKEMKADKTFFKDNGQYMWWGGPWNSPATTLKQRLIEEIWIKNSPWDFPRYNPITLSGFEYWTGRYSPRRDRDLQGICHLKSSRALQVELNMQGRSVFPESKYDRQESRSRVKAGQELERFSGSGRYPESVREKYRSHGRTSSVAAVAASGPRIATDKMSSRRDDLKLRYM